MVGEGMGWEGGCEIEVMKAISKSKENHEAFGEGKKIDNRCKWLHSQFLGDLRLGMRPRSC